MNRTSLCIKASLFIFLLTAVLKSYCQDTGIKYNLDSTRYEMNFTVYRFQMPFDYLDHHPDEKDKRNLKNFGYLSRQLPDSGNFNKYYALACSLWELNRLEEAKKMFLIIFNADEKYYSANNYHSSDIIGDMTTNIYNYGSFSSNYKHSAALYLTKIYIEQNKFEKALSYLEETTKKYKVSFSCGTGFIRQQNEYDFLRACIYEGQKNYGKVMELLLPECLTRDDKIIVRTIKRLYSEREIEKQLQQAENSIQCEFDTVPSFSYRGIGYTDTLVYYSGKATINLFNKVLTLPKPDLENGERVTKERFLKEFRESSFYYNLTDH